MTFPPAIEDLAAEEDNENKFTEHPCNEEEDEVQFTYPDEDDDDDEEEEEDDDDEVQVVTRSRPHAKKSATNKAIAFNLEIHDMTGYEKADIIEL